MSDSLFQMLFSFLLLVLLVNTSASDSLPSSDNHDEETSLELVAILHRHGFRTPERTWPKDPYADQEKYWPIGWGQLLPKGKRQLYRLGKTYRERYADFISEYAANSVRVNSSDLDRCHMSVGALLAGWFPPQRDQIWTEELLWQPIPIHSVPRSEDRILGLKAPCPKYALVKEKIDKELKANETAADKRLFKYLTKHMGENVTAIHEIETYFSTMQIEDRFGYKLQHWTKKVYPGQMRKKYLQSMESLTWTEYQKRILGGPMIREVLEQFQKKIDGHHKHKKVYLYSAHDSTITHVRRALHFKDHLQPDFGASLIFELHKSETDFLVKLLYLNNTKTTKPYQLSIPNCPNPCTFAKLYNVTEYMRLVDWDTDCVIH